MKSLVKYLFVFIFAFVLAGAAGYLGVGVFTRSAPEVVLPDFSGKNIIQVLKTLTRLGLNPKLYDTQYHDTIPKYGVIFQDPKPGAIIKKGRDVVINISKGFKESQMPDLRQVVLKQGILTLEENELRPGRIVYVYCSHTPKQGIISQYPLPLTRVVSNSKCDFLVSKGPRPSVQVMPDLENISLDAAANKLEALSFSLDEIRSEFDPNRPRGQVVKQDPKFGTQVQEDVTIALVVNDPQGEGVMKPRRLKEMTWVSHTLNPGFSNQHVRVVTDLFGKKNNFFNGYMKPGKTINLLVPGGIKTRVLIFVDHQLVKTLDIDPWHGNLRLAWEDPVRHFILGEQSWQ
ncbi:MAG: PASTA domain-containing protein [Desulfobacter sp.]|nr:MAG: PASTA domain-containing protein [Desulfobacter sp.]